MSFWKQLLGSKEPAGTEPATVTPQSTQHIWRVSTSFPSQAAAEEVLASSGSENRLEAASALGMTNSQQVVPTLTKALLSDQNKYVRAVCAGYLGCIKGAEAEKSLLQAMDDPDPYVRQRIVEALFRLATEQALEAVHDALKDPASEVQATARKYASLATKKVQKRICPFLSEYGMCDPPGVDDLEHCAWETKGRGHYSGCLLYKASTHPGGRADFLRRNI